MEFVGKATSRTNLNGIRGQGNFFGPTLMEFVGKATSRTNLNGIRGQGNFSDQP